MIIESSLLSSSSARLMKNKTSMRCWEYPLN